jgi:hypothetical protein
MSVLHPVVCNPLISPRVDVSDPVGWRAGRSALAVLFNGKALLWNGKFLIWRP